MLGRVIEIAEEGRHLSVYRGFMLVSDKEQGEIARIALDDIAIILAHAHQISYSNTLLMECCARGIGFVFTGTNHQPAGFLWPTEQHHEQSGIMRDQCDAPLPLCKGLWKTLTQAKIRLQAEQLERISQPDGALLNLAREVRSGDPDNLEAQAARRYWPLMMGEGFTRNRTTPDALNAMLNYGYSILRATVARAIMAAGLHPALGIHHRNRQNTMPLADDLIEPFRPAVDCMVRKLATEEIKELGREQKQVLAGIHLLDCTVAGETSPLGVAILRTATSLANSYKERSNLLVLPESLFPPKQASLMSCNN